MPELSASDPSVPRPTLGYAPSTFLERGAVVPFTTPQLTGGRVRPADRGDLELIVGNPAGGRGVYIVPFQAVYALCSPTVHDRLLIKGVQELPSITPPAIRQVALDIAERGLAGRTAAAAAEVTRAAEGALRTATNFELLLMLMRQVLPDGGEADGDFQAKAKRAIEAVAPRLQLTADDVATQLEELAALFSPLGVGSGTIQARIPRGLATVARLRSEFSARLRGPPVIRSPDAELVLASAELTIACARATAEAATAMLSDLPALLRRLTTERASIAAKVARSDWVLDGWDRIALVWQQGGRDQDRLFAELADLVPATPREVGEWVHAPVESAAGLLRHNRRVVLNEDWRSGVSLHDLVARNERLRAAELELA
jgi:hypothetical protein